MCKALLRRCPPTFAGGLSISQHDALSMHTTSHNVTTYVQDGEAGVMVCCLTSPAGNAARTELHDATTAAISSRAVLLLSTLRCKPSMSPAVKILLWFN